MSEPGSSATLHGKYQLIAELGHGGMADVYLAVLRQMKGFQKLAVVKRLRSHLAEDPEFLAMFLQEARIAARLNHPNVVHTFEVGHDGRNHFIAMEYLQGHAYSALIARVGREQLDVALQIKILIDALEGLSYAHELKDFDGRPMGLVHRDISPQNIFVTYDGQVKILDFGIAKAFDSAVETRTGVVKGKLAYMSPEQAFGNPVDNRSDLYSVGVLLWELIAQRRRWKGMANIEVMKRIVASENELDLPSLEGRGLPPSLGRILERSLAFDAARRYQTALEFQADLEKVLDDMGRRINTREVGKFVADQFAEDRKRLESVIDEEIKRLESDGPRVNVSIPTDNLVHIEVPAASFTPTLDSPGTRTTSPTVATTDSATISVSELVNAAAKRRSRPVAWLAALLGLLFVSATVGLVIREQARSAATPVAGSTGPPAADQPPQVHVKIAANPKSATLYLDGRRLGGNPYTGVLPRSGATAEIKAEDPNHETEVRIVKLDTDVQLEMELKPLIAAPATSASASAAQTATRGKRFPAGVRPPPPPNTEAGKAAATPPAETGATKPTPKGPKPGVTLDQGNPWEKKSE